MWLMLLELLVSKNCISDLRGVAQLASALAWGARGRTFESYHPDD